MLSETELSEYLEEIRKQVCSRCIERPMDGPPCAPRGKACGVELHLAEYVDLAHRIDSPFMAFYTEGLHRGVCAHCARLGLSGCPCSLDYLLPLVVRAVETVDERHNRTAVAVAP